MYDLCHPMYKRYSRTKSFFSMKFHIINILKNQTHLWLEYSTIPVLLT